MELGGREKEGQLLSVLWVFPSWHFSLYSELTDSVSLSLSLHVCPSHSPSSCLSHSVSPSLSLLLLLSLSSSKAFLHFSQFSIFSFFLQKHTQVLFMTVFPPLSHLPSTHAPVVAFFLLLFHHLFLFLLLFFVVLLVIVVVVTLRWIEVFSSRSFCCCPSVSLAFVRVHWQFLPLVLFVARLSFPLPHPLSLPLALSTCRSLIVWQLWLNFCLAQTLSATKRFLIPRRPSHFTPSPSFSGDLHQSINRSISRSIQSVNTFSIYTRLTNKFLFAPPQKYVSLADTQWNVLPLACPPSLSPSHSLPFASCLPL